MSTSERAARLTQKLLAFARQQMVKLETLSLAELVSNLREMLDRLLGETVFLTIDIEPPVRFVRADWGHMEQVLLNLVVNARDAIENDGAIAVAVRNADVDDWQAGQLGCDAGSYVVLDVIDNGGGIPADVQPHIFDPFYTTKAPGQGTGLGLSTCYGIVRQLNGVIDVDTGDEGTRLSVYLPEGPAPDSRPAVDVTDRVDQPARILVVEDQAQVRQTIARMLELGGNTVFEAENGIAALQQLSELSAVDLVVSDMAMPEMAGRDLAERLRTDYPDVKILFVTGNLGVPDPPTDDNRDPPLVLQKPFTIDQLKRAVSESLHRRRRVTADQRAG